MKRLLKKQYKLVISCVTIAAVLAYGLTVIIRAPEQFTAKSSIYLHKTETFTPKFAKQSTIVPVDMNDLMRLINDKETLTETGLRLLALHLTSPETVKSSHLKSLQATIPSNIWALAGETDSVTYLNLAANATKNPFLIGMINLPDMPYYSNAAISSSVMADRLDNGDIISLSFTSNDAGISHKTLEILIDVIARNSIKTQERKNNEIKAYYEEYVRTQEKELNRLKRKLQQFAGNIPILSRKDLLQRILSERDSLSKWEGYASTAVKRLGTKASLKTAAIIKSRNKLADLHQQFIRAELNQDNDLTPHLHMLIVREEAAFERAVTAANKSIAQRFVHTYAKHTAQYEKSKNHLAVLEKLREEYEKPGNDSILMLQQDIDVGENNYLAALDDFHQSLAFFDEQSAAPAAVIQVIEAPKMPETPKARYITVVLVLAGIVFGLAASVFGVYVKSVFSKIKTPERVEKKTGLTVAGVIPNEQKLQVRKDRERIKSNLIYHMLKQFFQVRHQTQQRILIVSVQPHEGKTTVSNMIQTWLQRKGKKCNVVVPYFDSGCWLLRELSDEAANDLMPLEYFADMDVLLMVLPPLSDHNYPVELIRMFSTTFLVCRADREWGKGDQKTLDNFMHVSGITPKIILNHVGMSVTDRFNMVQTYFSTPDRNVQSVVKHEHAIIRKNQQAMEIVRSMPNLCVILDKNRQIVYANEAMTSLLGLSNMDKTLGLRPGELVSCIYSDITPGGCGTSKSCQNCGAVNTILKCMKSHKHEEGECQINSFINGQIGVFKFKITCSPFEVDDDFYVITNLAEIRGDQEKIDQLLEKTKTDKPANVNAFAEMIEKIEEKGKLETFTETLAQTNSPINENIIDRQQLSYAETNQLKVYIAPVNAYKLLLKTVHNMRCHDAARGKEIKIAPPFPTISVDTDAALLQQILRNMMKNALEATPLQGTIHIGYERNTSTLTFYVFNESVIPEKVQQHIFERAFTTKEKAKGLGTYSMKLLGEHYLKGTVGFESSEGLGTRFFISLPFSGQMTPEAETTQETAVSHSLNGEWIDPIKNKDDNTVLSIDDLISELSKINHRN
ncbi:MAG: hypothetical protein LBS03_02145 [Bacteroidales bacterium]|jgi:nitrogen-specific signal transduction histidine kinase/capsular polysaccharide biosynthesis protein|nr:hypothetical protein [Bacteroidales bacterium]